MNLDYSSLKWNSNTPLTNLVSGYPLIYEESYPFGRTPYFKGPNK